MASRVWKGSPRAARKSIPFSGEYSPWARTNPHYYNPLLLLSAGPAQSSDKTYLSKHVPQEQCFWCNRDSSNSTGKDILVCARSVMHSMKTEHPTPLCKTCRNHIYDLVGKKPELPSRPVIKKKKKQEQGQTRKEWQQTRKEQQPGRVRMKHKGYKKKSELWIKIKKKKKQEQGQTRKEQQQGQAQKKHEEQIQKKYDGQARKKQKQGQRQPPSEEQKQLQRLNQWQMQRRIRQQKQQSQLQLQSQQHLNAQTGD